MLVENMSSGLDVFAISLAVLVILSLVVLSVVDMESRAQTRSALAVLVVSSIAFIAVMCADVVVSKDLQADEIERVYDVSVVSVDGKHFTAISDDRAVNGVLDCGDEICVAYEVGGSELPKR